MNFSAPSHLEGLDATGYSVDAVLVASNADTPVQLISVSGEGYLMGLIYQMSAIADYWNFEIILDGVTVAAYDTVKITARLATDPHYMTFGAGLKFSATCVVNGKMAAADAGYAGALVMYK